VQFFENCIEMNFEKIAPIGIEEEKAGVFLVFTFCQLSVEALKVKHSFARECSRTLPKVGTT